METAKQTILCVDDEQVNLKVLDAVLSPRGYQVVMTQNPREVSFIVEKKPVDLILLDVMMPEMDGYTVCRRIKENPQTRHIPIVMITVLSSKEDRIKGIDAGADDFITKPFDQELVLARVRMLLKMKSLNDRLNHGYHNIIRLTSFGEEILKDFSARDFRFFEVLSGVVKQVLRQSGDIQDNPLIVIVGTSHKKHWEWYQFESAFNELYQTRLNIKIQENLALPAPGDSQVMFFNEGESDESRLRDLVRMLESESLLSVRNGIGYLSPELCVFSLNYGRDVTVYDASVLNSLVMQSLFLKSLSNQILETEDALEHTVRALVRASEANDEDKGNHVIRVGAFSALLAETLGMPGRFVRAIWLQAQMHDVGMVRIPAQILRKAGALSDTEKAVIRKHPLFGAEIIGSHPRFRKARSIALTHHERWDGNGYPHNLQGEKIPIEGRIVCLADHYDSMRCAKSYRPAMSHEQAVHKILEGDESCRPEHFDPRVLKAFQLAADRFASLFKRLEDPPAPRRS
ncbi:MAG TPA: response regulator [Candidatus Aminicenantes bacterium]|nr:response regulator [Candidatus Aminicenantes bacterium]